MSRIVATRDLDPRDIDGVSVRVVEQTWADGAHSYEVWRDEVDLTVNESFDTDPTDEQIRALLDGAHTEGDGCAIYDANHLVTRDGEDIAVADLRAGDTFTEDGYGEQVWIVREVGRDRDYVHLDLDGAGAGLPAVVALSPTLRGLLAHAEAYAAGGITPYTADDTDPLDLLRDIVAQVRAGAVTGGAAERNGAALALLDRLDESAESYSTDTIRAALVGDGPDRTGVYSYLDASTYHLPPGMCQRLSSFDGVTADRLGEDGWLLAVPADPDAYADDYGDPDDEGDGVPEAVLVLQRFARERGCDRVLLDRDAPVLAGLPTFEWA